jgi:hypothetical protein
LALTRRPARCPLRGTARRRAADRLGGRLRPERLASASRTPWHGRPRTPHDHRRSWQRGVAVPPAPGDQRRTARRPGAGAPAARRTRQETLGCGASPDGEGLWS